MSDAPEKPLNELLSRSMVDIYVGPENTHWILHEKLLCHHSPFFRKIFYSKSSSSSRTQSFGLPEEEDAPFKTFVGWLYSSSLPVPREEADLGTCFDLYLMAEKFEIPGLVADVLQVVREWYKYSDSYPGLRRVQYIYANTEEGSPMRHMLVHAVARMMVVEKGIPAHWDKALRKNGQLAVDIIRAIQDWRLDEEIVPDAREEPAEAEDLVDVEGETAKLDEEAEQEIDDELVERAEETADDSEDTVVESPTKESKQRPQVKGQKSEVEGQAKKTADAGLNKDFSKFSLAEMPNQIENADYGTLRA
ncbi:btb poz [Pyrenophora seminiperda CCB06]|uniref:Btb poz n=1 Tax=Pyrenophora seminiperda CCB06 TaxID=1302712 RepID=A0A3M7LYQ4_9PLEO|nr:btb poz [Pyrenophora seminiperda CCB06]